MHTQRKRARERGTTFLSLEEPPCLGVIATLGENKKTKSPITTTAQGSGSHVPFPAVQIYSVWCVGKRGILAFTLQIGHVNSGN